MDKYFEPIISVYITSYMRPQLLIVDGFGWKDISIAFQTVCLNDKLGTNTQCEHAGSEEETE